MENMDVLWEQVENTIKKVLDTHYWDDVAGEEYFSTLCADYRDEICDHTLKELMGADSPREALNEMFMDMKIESLWEHEYPTLKKEIADSLPEELYETFSEDISEWLEAHVHFNVDEKHYNKEVCLTLFVDSGDANYEYACNNVLNYASDGTGDFPEESSILWLAEQQGKAELLKKTVKNYELSGTRPNDRFVNSVISELTNLLSSVGALTFLVKMPLFEYLDLIEDVREKKDGTLTVPQNAVCGLFDKWNGGGSILEIELDKDVEIPFSMIGDLVPDIDKCHGVHGFMNWSVHNVFGVNDRLWKADASLHMNEKELEEVER